LVTKDKAKLVVPKLLISQPH